MTVITDIVASEGKYSALCSVGHPQLIVIMLDLSVSMVDPIGNIQKIEKACDVINRFVIELVDQNFCGEFVRNRYFISILGYCKECEELSSGYLNEYYEHPLRIEDCKGLVSDGNGSILEVPYKKLCFVEAKTQSEGSDLTCAINYACSIVSSWIKDKMNCPAPIVINISDGINTLNIDASILEENVNSLKNMSSFDGPPLFYSLIINQDFVISILDSNNKETDSVPLYKVCSFVPNNHCERVYSAYDYTLYDEVHSPLKGITTNPKEMFAIINASSHYCQKLFDL